jgi:hypothetical protein
VVPVEEGKSHTPQEGVYDSDHTGFGFFYTFHHL